MTWWGWVIAISGWWLFLALVVGLTVAQIVKRSSIREPFPPPRSGDCS